MKYPTMDNIEEFPIEALQFHIPFSMLIAGSSGSGKSTWIEKLLIQQSNVLNKTWDKILYCYSIYDPSYEKLEKIIPNLELMQGFPTEIVKQFHNNVQRTKQTLIVLEDLMVEAGDLKELTILFTRMRHSNVSIIMTVQNIFHQGKAMKAVMRNATYIVVFPNTRDISMIYSFGQQIMPGKSKFFLSCFEKAKEIDKFLPLIIDLSPKQNEKLRFRQGIFPSDPKYVYDVE